MYSRIPSQSEEEGNVTEGYIHPEPGRRATFYIPCVKARHMRGDEVISHFMYNK